LVFKSKGWTVKEGGKNQKKIIEEKTAKREGLQKAKKRGGLILLQNSLQRRALLGN